MTTDQLEFYLSRAVAGSLLGAVAARRNLDIDNFIEPDNAECNALITELSDLGIYPQVIAHHTLDAISTILCEPSNADRIATTLTDLLWTILGDPKNGGSPPELYRRAGCAMYVTLLGILCPSVIESPLND